MVSKIFLLVHAPLLGPATWELVRRELGRAGHTVVVPDLRGCLIPPQGWWDRAADAAVRDVPEPPDVVVGHSGAGTVLPLVAHRAGARRVVFADAAIPAESGVTRPSEQMRELIRSLAAGDGQLPPWSRWWGRGVMEELVPDQDTRQAIEAEQVRLPANFYDEDVPVPDEWGSDVHYVQLSPAYDEDAAMAAERGWTVTKLPGLHLDIVRRPGDVAAALERVAASR
ncbi:alpha/beta hydrolase [Actinobacteria bacterium YIM 96077]|uniref:Alpha/beta hydrolase n=1 Tax=Phytoactinopolyspora halophila TaxID=1981511 RepID=A0A329QJI6_9ACTN|nr:alpha/beta hydrolase [Phytoactinopolyspora halophila]AYY13512.1 alpha/beta hydrolase [Actinobacteria bacterium YIM 96077]RAW12433.1 alpha/beta hydrolase [Phytoactinopolyspora halophila]